MTNIVPFHFEDHAIRAITDRDGQPWFVLADACGLLGIKNATDVAKRLDDTEKGRLNLGSGSDATIVSLAGLLTLMLRCRGAMKPETLPYRVRKWITAEVVPCIMRTGQYGSPATALDLSDPLTLQRLLIEHTGRAAEAEARVARLEPKAEALGRIADAEGLMCLADAAKALGVPPRRLSSWMEGAGWIFRRTDTGRHVAHSRKLDARLLEHKGYTLQRPGKPDKWVTQVMVTPKGLTKLGELRAGT